MARSEENIKVEIKEAEEQLFDLFTKDPRHLQILLRQMIKISEIMITKKCSCEEKTAWLEIAIAARTILLKQLTDRIEEIDTQEKN